jgi:hypothetical protein
MFRARSICSFEVQKIQSGLSEPLQIPKDKWAWLLEITAEGKMMEKFGARIVSSGLVCLLIQEANSSGS